MRSNPFATRFVAPGRLPWLPVQGIDLEGLARRFLEELNARAAIVGPHGSGKSTLLAHLVPELVRFRDADRRTPPADVVWLQLRRRERPLRQVLASHSNWRPSGLLVVDGWEQLLPPSRLLVGMLANRVRMGMLATSHRRDVRLPMLVSTDPDVETVRKLVVGALARHPNLPSHVRMELTAVPRLARLLSEEGGNVREVLMRLYDRYEELIGNGSPPPPNPSSTPLDRAEPPASNGRGTDLAPRTSNLDSLDR